MQSVVHHYEDHPALHQDGYALIRMLVAAGADISTELQPYDRSVKEAISTTALHRAAESGEVELLRIIVETPGGTQALAYFDFSDRTPLGVPIASGWMGNTPLDRAKQSGASRIVRLLESYVPRGRLTEHLAERRRRSPKK